ncbi:hypothetical protein T484DRAFT_1645525, partial [Baffinella frigidus]
MPGQSCCGRGDLRRNSSKTFKECVQYGIASTTVSHLYQSRPQSCPSTPSHVLWGTVQIRRLWTWLTPNPDARSKLLRTGRSKEELLKDVLVTPTPETRNPRPETRDPRPETRDPKPETRNPKPETRNPKPETRDPKPETRNP